MFCWPRSYRLRLVGKRITPNRNAFGTIGICESARADYPFKGGMSLGDGGPADGLAVPCPRSLVRFGKPHNGPEATLVRFQWRLSVRFQLSPADSDAFRADPAPPSMRRRTPYPAGWKPALSQNGRDNGLAVSKSTEIVW